MDKKRMPIYASDKAMSLQEIALYTKEGEMPLGEVLDKVYAHLEGQKMSDERFIKGKKEELYALMEEILPVYDRSRVYPTDIKKLFTWYNLLLDNGFTKFARIEESKEEKPDAEEAGNDK